MSDMQTGYEALPARPASEIGVLRRPGAILILWALRLTGAVLLALPFVHAIEATGVGRFPEGDALLFEAGGMMLVETLRLADNGLRSAFDDMVFIALIVLFANLVLLAALLVALASNGRLRLAPWILRTAEHVPNFTWLSGLTLLAQGGVLCAFALLYSMFLAPFGQQTNERTADLVTGASSAVAVLAILSVGIFQDLARVALVRHREGIGAALRAALRTYASSFWSVTIGWLNPTLWSAAVILVTALLVERIPLERPGLRSVLVVLALHQLAALLLVFFRAMWLSRALQLVSRVRP
jgi:hypothetical protein